MAIASYETIHAADRMFNLVRDCTTGTGNDHRCHIMCMGDSTNGRQSFKVDGSSIQDDDQVWGWWEGLQRDLYERGLLWGGPMSNASSNNAFARVMSMGFGMAAQDYATNDPYTAGAIATLTDNRSFPYSGNAFWNGPLQVVTATPSPASPSGSSCASIRQVSPIAQSQANPYLFGDLTANDCRLAFSWASNSAGTSGVVQSHADFDGTPNIGQSASLNTNTAKVMTDTSFLVTANASTRDRVISLHDYRGSGQTTGPLIYSGIQFTHKLIDPTTPTTGPCGFAVSPLKIRIGQTMTQDAADLKYVATTYPKAIGEFMRAATRSCKYMIVDLHYLGNDVFTSSVNAFKYTDSPAGVDARASTPTTTGPDQSTAAGVVCNLSTICQILEEAWVGIGRDPRNLRIWFSGAHPQDSGTNAANGYAAIYQGVCDWIDGSATYSAFRPSQCVFVSRQDRIITPATIRAINGYDQPPTVDAQTVLVIDQITAASPAVIRTTVAHGLTIGSYVRLNGTNETANGTMTRLSDGTVISGTTTLVPPTQWKVAAASFDSTHITVTGAVNPISGATVTGNASVAGTKGYVSLQIDLSHLRAHCSLVLARMNMTLLFGASGAFATAASSTSALNNIGIYPTLRNRNQ